MKTNIEYADEVSNPLMARPIGDESVKIGTFCEKPDAEGTCKNCWAESWNLRFGNKLAFDKSNRDKIEWQFREKEFDRMWRLNAKKPMSDKFPGLPLVVFCCDTFDIFQPSISDEMRDRVFGFYNELKNLTLLFQTTYPAKMSHYLNKLFPYVADNFRIGISAGTQFWLDKNLRYLKEVRASFRYVIFEPLLEEITFAEYGGFIPAKFSIGGNQPIHQVIVGGESGANPRPMQIDWARRLKRECVAAGVAFFMKQDSKANNKKYKEFNKLPIDLQIREMPEIKL